MPEPAIAGKPRELGFDSKRLTRISSHFRDYVDDGRLAGWSLLVSRRGQVAYSDHYGQRDLSTGAPIENDTIYRIYSMTKPITTVAAMILYEEGAFDLNDPVEKFIPSFANQRVYLSGSASTANTAGVLQPMAIHHLMSHTAGLTYGFLHAHAIDEMYRNAGYEWDYPAGHDLAACCDDWAGLPLLFQPGDEWNYSVASDVLGRIVEVASGMTLDEFFRTRIFEPLAMDDTSFWADTEERQARLATLYTRNPADGSAVPIDAMGKAALHKPKMLSGGGGLVSTIGDYHRFTQMLLNRGELDGERLLGSRTVDYMAINHLPGGQDLPAYGRPIFTETAHAGMGFGLGFSVVIDRAATKLACSDGEYSWGGAASTGFWIDPAEEITAVFMTQLLPSSTYPLRPEFRQLVYQALID
ncbi:MAG: serine hydrolase domain-containing protein [Acidimicrobiales bacterium]